MLSARTVLVRLPERDPVACAPSFSRLQLGFSRALNG